MNIGIDDYKIVEETNVLKIQIPYGNICGELRQEGGTIEVNNSPVLSFIEYLKQDDETLVADFHLKKVSINYEIQEYSTRLVMDIQH
ncbi:MULTISPECIES: hypothetical protein [Clostridia]|uniref:hypothetical protein n=1 Tax=Clostridia TaxID=186801 RepID=UPI000EA0C77F|nr:MULTISPECIES: hypothetical protein [Clostridia]NBJ71041.1 hypothetical protein [Roseburia sp. 1XD42-34]RKI75323.1 hypothetical protein D7V87_16495 [Clostridium sp. 1xD42-85]